MLEFSSSIEAAFVEKSFPVCQINCKLFLLNSPIFASMVSLILCAPRLPPKTNTVFSPDFNPKNFKAAALSTVSKNTWRTGFPVTIILFSGKYLPIPSEATNIFCALLASNTLLFPPSELASWINVGIPLF